MRVLVTGGAGFIGSRLIARLLARCDEVTVIDVVPLEMHGCRFVRASVLDADAMLRVIRDADAVVHLAGYIREAMRRHPYAGSSLQLQGTLNVLQACNANNVPHIAYASSSYVYDGIPASETVDEQTPLNPLVMELFGSAKLMGEALCLEYAKTYGVGFTIFRLGPIYGVGGSSAVGEFIKTGLQGRPIDVWGRGDRHNQYTYVEDVADALVAGLSRSGEIFNVISPEAVSIRQVAELLAEEFGFEVGFDERRPEGASLPYMSASKAIQQLGWRPLSLREGVRLTIQGMVERLGLSGVGRRR